MADKGQKLAHKARRRQGGVGWGWGTRAWPTT